MKFVSYRYRLWINITALLAAVVVAVVPISVSQRIHSRMVAEERAKMELWVSATEAAGGDDMNAPFNVMLQIISSNTTIPVILTDDRDSIITFNNIRIASKLDTLATLANFLNKFKQSYKPLPIDLGSEGTQYLYYDDSSTLRELYFFPLIQGLVFGFFVVILGVAWFLAYKNGQNRLWVGLSKETAHQLGTPISSLMAWIELLREAETDEAMLGEIGKDVARLETISHRFQKIGSEPYYEERDLREEIRKAFSYLEHRISKGVKLFTNFPEEAVVVDINPELFEWVVENLVKNAVDAMEGRGEILLEISIRSKRAIIDVTDTGKGIARQNRRRIFHPGFTTKKKGWGLGLSLAKRIINHYHHGRISLLRSEQGVGTTFRIKLPL